MVAASAFCTALSSTLVVTGLESLFWPIRSTSDGPLVPTPANTKVMPNTTARARNTHLPFLRMRSLSVGVAEYGASWRFFG